MGNPGRLLAILLLCVWAAQAQVGALVAGQVTDRGNRSGIRKATVAATLYGPRSTTIVAQTDGEGRFMFPELDAGTYRITASAPGFETAVFGASAADQPGRFVMLGPGETRLDVNIGMRATGVLSGTVTDDEGDPVKRAQVTLLRTVYERGKARLTPAYQSQTDDRGRYRAFGLRAGKYRLMASSQMIHTTRTNPEVRAGENSRPAAYGVVFYPNAARVADAEAITVPAGGELKGINLRLPLETTVRLRGRVQPPAGMQLGAPVEVTLFNADTPASMSYAMGIHATPPGFVFDRDQVRPGRYEMSASVVVDGRTYRAAQEVEVGPQGMEGLVLALEPPVDLKGTLVLDGEAGNAPRPIVRLIPGTPGSHMPAAAAAFDGSAFTIHGVPPGLWDIEVSPLPEGGYLKGMWLGEVDVLTRDMVITSKTNEKLRIVVSTRGARVEGDVEIPESDSGRQVSVLLAPEGDKRQVLSLYTVENTTPDGHFILDGLTPGKYRVYAFEELNPRAYMDPDFLKPLAGLGKEIDLKEGDSFRLTDKLRMIGAAQMPAEE
ncbi:MAG: carboxypeptidase-like regulatory domain-containing protein [Bryobacteraceae bacterium]|nr:carboxypeptidase-like regulatory domain-containing protein [Bryobacteraceae bacterium]